MKIEDFVKALGEALLYSWDNDDTEKCRELFTEHPEMKDQIDTIASYPCIDTFRAMEWVVNKGKIKTLKVLLELGFKVSTPDACSMFYLFHHEPQVTTAIQQREIFFTLLRHPSFNPLQKHSNEYPTLFHFLFRKAEEMAQLRKSEQSLEIVVEFTDLILLKLLLIEDIPLEIKLPTPLIHRLCNFHSKLVPEVAGGLYINHIVFEKFDSDVFKKNSGFFRADSTPPFTGSMPYLNQVRLAHLVYQNPDHVKTQIAKEIIRTQSYLRNASDLPLLRELVQATKEVAVFVNSFTNFSVALLLDDPRIWLQLRGKNLQGLTDKIYTANNIDFYALARWWMATGEKHNAPLQDLLNNIKNQFSNAGYGKTYHANPALQQLHLELLFYCFDTIVNSNANENEKDGCKEIIKEFSEGFYELKWVLWMLYRSEFIKAPVPKGLFSQLVYTQEKEQQKKINEYASSAKYAIENCELIFPRALPLINNLLSKCKETVILESLADFGHNHYNLNNDICKAFLKCLEFHILENLEKYKIPQNVVEQVYQVIEKPKLLNNISISLKDGLFYKPVPLQAKSSQTFAVIATAPLLSAVPSRNTSPNRTRSNSVCSVSYPDLNGNVMDDLKGAAAQLHQDVMHGEQAVVSIDDDNNAGISQDPIVQLCREEKSDQPISFDLIYKVLRERMGDDDFKRMIFKIHADMDDIPVAIDIPEPASEMQSASLSTSSAEKPKPKVEIPVAATEAVRLFTPAKSNREPIPELNALATTAKKIEWIRHELNKAGKQLVAATQALGHDSKASDIILACSKQIAKLTPWVKYLEKCQQFDKPKEGNPLRALSK